MTAVPVALSAAGQVTLDAAGGGRLELGPDTGPPYWRVTRIGVQTTRGGVSARGLPPIPSCTVYLDSEDINGLLDGTYDGSFDFSDVDVALTRGQHLIAVWAGGLAGDVAALSVYGERRTA